MKTLTRKERLHRCYFNQELDRPAVYSRTGFPANDPTYDRLKAYLDAHTELKTGWSGCQFESRDALKTRRAPYSEDFEREVEDFNDFNTKYDKPIIDLIHDAGGRIHIHSHGSIKRVFQGFLDMGVDVLHPFEPPPQGDILAREAKALACGRMCLEGNIQIHRHARLRTEAPSRHARSPGSEAIMRTPGLFRTPLARTAPGCYDPTKIGFGGPSICALTK